MYVCMCKMLIRSSIVIAIRKGVRKSRKHAEQTLMNIIKIVQNIKVSNNCI